MKTVRVRAVRRLSRQWRSSPGVQDVQWTGAPELLTAFYILLNVASAGAFNSTEVINTAGHTDVCYYYITIAGDVAPRLTVCSYRWIKAKTAGRIKMPVVTIQKLTLHRTFGTILLKSCHVKHASLYRHVFHAHIPEKLSYSPNVFATMWRI